LQGFLLQVDEAEIVAHEADDPNAVVNFLDAEALAGKDGRDIDALAMHADAAAGGHQEIALVQRIVSETLETVLFAWSIAGFALRFAAGEAVATAADRAVFDKMLQATSSAGDKLELDVLDRAVGWSEDVTKVFDSAARTGRELSEAQLDELCKAADAKWGNPGRAAQYVSTGLPNKPISDFGREISDGVKRYFVH
jgi:hypothetical protein